MGLYKLYEQRVWPRISAALNKDEALGEERKKTVQRAQGVVLEIGFGMGPNLAHYDPQKVEKLYGLSPRPVCQSEISGRARPGLRVVH